MLVVETIPGFVNASLELGRAHLSLGQSEEALKIFEHVASVDPGNPYGYLLQAQIYVMKVIFFLLKRFSLISNILLMIFFS